MALKSKDLSTVRQDLPTEKVAASVDGADMVRVNLEVTKATRTAWRAEALRRDIPLSDLIRQAMSAYIGK